MSTRARKDRKAADEPFVPKAPNPRAVRVPHPSVIREQRRKFAAEFKAYQALSPEEKVAKIKAARERLETTPTTHPNQEKSE